MINLVVFAVLIIAAPSAIFAKTNEPNSRPMEIPALKTHWANGTLLFDSATAAKDYYIQKNIQQQKQAIINACKFHNVRMIIICPPSLSSPLQLSPSNMTSA